MRVNFLQDEGCGLQRHLSAPRTVSDVLLMVGQDVRADLTISTVWFERIHGLLWRWRFGHPEWWLSSISSHRLTLCSQSHDNIQLDFEPLTFQWLDHA